MQDLIEKIFLSPLAVLYGLGVWLRQMLYRTNLLRRSSFDVPTVVVGNLTAGGAGKSPHVEYLVRLLSPYIEIGTLSRGYGRKTEGFRIVQANSLAQDVGDEPLQFKQKFQEITVAIGEKRAYAIPMMLQDNPNIETILMDDAMQHLAVKPYLTVMLTEFDALFTRDFLLPVGKLREFRTGASRADIIVVSKCPPPVSEQKKTEIIAEIAPKAHQKIFFSYYKYFNPYKIFNKNLEIELDLETDILLVCGIAKTDYLQKYVASKTSLLHLLAFSDHRIFTNFDLGQIKATYDNMRRDGRKVIVLTTEKDAMRLTQHQSYIEENQIPIFILPIEVDFLFDEKIYFDAAIKNALLDFKI